MLDYTKLMEKAADHLLVYGPKLVLALFTLIIGLWIIRVLIRGIDRAMERADVDASLRPFLESLAGILFKLLLVISVASMIGIQMTSFVAVLGAAGLAIGLALQGSLANFAVRVWVNTADYWDVYFASHESVKREFDKNDISIPYPQTDVHLHQE